MVNDGRGNEKKDWRKKPEGEGQRIKMEKMRIIIGKKKTEN